MRQSDYGLDLLGTIVDTQLKAVNFLAFKVADALEVFKADMPMKVFGWCKNHFDHSLQWMKRPSPSALPVL